MTTHPVHHTLDSVDGQFTLQSTHTWRAALRHNLGQTAMVQMGQHCHIRACFPPYVFSHQTNTLVLYTALLQAVTIA